MSLNIYLSDEKDPGPTFVIKANRGNIIVPISWVKSNTDYFNNMTEIKIADNNELLFLCNFFKIHKDVNSNTSTAQNYQELGRSYRDINDIYDNANNTHPNLNLDTEKKYIEQNFTTFKSLAYVMNIAWKYKFTGFISRMASLINIYMDSPEMRAEIDEMYVSDSGDSLDDESYD